jgi:uncharacterized protein (DUF433 family)
MSRRRVRTERPDGLGIGSASEGGTRIAESTSTGSDLPDDDPRVARPIFTLKETAAYLGIPPSTVQFWSSASRGRPLITRADDGGRQASVPFIGFAEAYVLSALRRAGVPMQRIRPAVEKLSREIDLDHALASRRLYTDGVELLYDYAVGRAPGEALELVVVRTQQRQFSDLVKDYLRRVSYGHDGWATSITLPVYDHAEVIVDPQIAFGQPMVSHGGARVEDLIDRFRSGDTVAELAEDFGVPPEEVEDVIRIATRIAA